MNAANEIAVDAFLDRRIGFLDIVATVEAVLDRLGPHQAETLDAVLALDQTSPPGRPRYRKGPGGLKEKARGSAPWTPAKGRAFGILDLVC